jgi:uncharacterized YkwD family protein
MTKNACYDDDAKQKKELSKSMMKKLSIITALFTILIGGIFASSVSASVSDQGEQNSYKIYYSINEVQKHLPGNEFWQNFINQNQQSEWQNDEQHQQQNAVPAEQTATEEKEQNTENSAEELSQFEQEVVDLTNEERSKQGLQALQVDTNLSEVAREKSRDMATSNYFDHNSPNYGSPFDMMQQFGISYQTAGENIAKGQRSPQEVVDAWMNSEGHRANILNGNFTHIGVGFVEQGNHWTQMFIGK